MTTSAITPSRVASWNVPRNQCGVARPAVFGGDGYIHRMLEGRETGVSGANLWAPIAAAVVGAFGGFIFGIGTDQVDAYVNRADSCYDALVHPRAGIREVPVYIERLREGDVGAQRQWNTEVHDAYNGVLNKCPFGESRNESAKLSDNEYLQAADMREFLRLDMAVDACTTGCDSEVLAQSVSGASSASMVLMDQANTVKDWSVAHRCKYVLTHLF